MQAGIDELCRRIREEEFERPSRRISSLAEDHRTSLAHHRGEAATFEPRLRGDLDWIVMKAVDKDRNRRYASASAFAEDINHYLNQEPVAAAPPSAAYQLQKFVRRHRLTVLAASLVATSLILGLAVATLGMLRARDQARQTEDALGKLSVKAGETEKALIKSTTATHRAEAAERAAMKTAYFADMQAARQALQLDNLASGPPHTRT